jgi:hypothetical protein
MMPQGYWGSLVFYAQSGVIFSLIIVRRNSHRSNLPVSTGCNVNTGEIKYKFTDYQYFIY